MSDMNKKWAKLYTQTESQMMVTITPSKNGFLVEKQMMINGVHNSLLCYDGGDEEYARDIFESITRDDVATTQQDMLNGSPEDVVEEKKVEAKKPKAKAKSKAKAK